MKLQPDSMRTENAESHSLGAVRPMLPRTLWPSRRSKKVTALALTTGVLLVIGSFSSGEPSHTALGNLIYDAEITTPSDIDYYKATLLEGERVRARVVRTKSSTLRAPRGSLMLADERARTRSASPKKIRHRDTADSGRRRRSRYPPHPIPWTRPLGISGCVCGGRRFRLRHSGRPTLRKRADSPVSNALPRSSSSSLTTSGASPQPLSLGTVGAM